MAIMLVTILCAAAATLGTRAAVLFTAVKVCFADILGTLIMYRFTVTQVAALVCPATS
jgi:hypothetical protein